MSTALRSERIMSGWEQYTPGYSKKIEKTSNQSTADMENGA
jgi:hypothetical protein